jgi:hypothetical protein
MKTKNQQTFASFAEVRGHIPAPFIIRLWLLLLLALLMPTVSQAVETVCARVKIEIKQELTLERQAFDAQMKINNTTVDGIISNVSVEVKVTDENGTPVAITADSNDQTAKFFLRVSGKQGISDITGIGSVAPQTAATINWLLIPAPGSAGNNPFGKKYLVGAALKYTFGGEDTVLDVSPDVITVKPLPLLTLDYFLTQNVWADDALTPEIEPVEPFTLGVRVKNEGFAAAKALKIDSAQPKIIENNQGLLISFLITGSYVDDKPAQNTLLIDFGDIAPATSKMGRWVMETSLAGKFTEFVAKFSHADELGGTLTSIIKATNPHFLLHDVWVDLPGRDSVRDFLAQDGNVVTVYESDGTDTEATNRSSVATLIASSSGDQANYLLNIPATDGFAYVKLPDPFSGKKEISRMVRSDGKLVSPVNAWLSKTRNEATKQWQYWVNLFDMNTTGHYAADFQTPQVVAVAPQLQFIPNRQVQETRQVSFLVEASSPQGKPVTITAGPLPQGASFAMQPASPATPGLVRAVFDWKPAKGQAGDYPITYTASDGALSTNLIANIKVEAFTPPHGPETPTIEQPLSGAQVTRLKPTLAAQASTNPDDLTTQIQFEVYADASMTQLLASEQVDKAVPAPGNGGGPVPQPTEWTVPNDLTDNTHYWWRTRAFDGVVYSPWATAQFFVNLYNDAPNTFNLIYPDPGLEVSTLTPALTWNNSTDKDGDDITYDVAIYKDPALNTKVAKATDVPADASGNTSWTDTMPLVNHSTYYWNVTAKDTLGAQTISFARPFTVNTGNEAPTNPVIVTPAIGGQSGEVNPVLEVQNSEDADHDPLTYVFEIDTVNTFDSAAKKTSGVVTQGIGDTTDWPAGDLIENQHYWWRVKAQDGHADSTWVVGDFLMNIENDQPETPTVKNPGSGSWTAVLQPILEANPAIDPEGEEVRYQFEVYQSADLSVKVSESISNTTVLMLPAPLTDKTTYWWRVRALDPQDAASGWSPATLLYVSTGPYQPPTIAVTEPAIPIAPTIARSTTVPGGMRKEATINWEGVGPNIESTVALFYDTQNSGFAGTLIKDGLTQKAGTQKGSYTWDVTNLSLAPGAYYIYATITDAGGKGKAYAPGAIVFPTLHQAGGIRVPALNTLRTTEGGGTAKYAIRLSGVAPVANVTVPLSSTDTRKGTVSPASLVFTPDNWSLDQAVVVTGKDNCAPGANLPYQIQPGKAVSLDPNYIGLMGAALNISHNDDSDLSGTTSNPNLHICGLAIVKEQKINAKLWEYTLSAQMSNTGASLNSITAKLTQLPATMHIIEDALSFGVANQGDTITSDDTIIIQSPTKVTVTTFKKAAGFIWTVTTSP